MSYLFGNKNPRPWSTSFHVRREASEGFSKPYYQPTPEWQLVKSLLAYPVRKLDFYYFDVKEYTSTLLACAKDVVEEKGWNLVRDVAILAREKGLVKDPPLVVAQIYPNGLWIHDLLSTYPITKIELYIDLARKYRSEFGWSWGRRKKSAIEHTLQTRPLCWHEVQAVKYRGSFRNVLRVVHPKPPSEEVNKVWRWVVGKGGPPSEYIEVADRIIRGELRGNEAVAEGVRVGLPWEVLRSHVGVGSVDSDLLYEAAIKLWSGNDVATQFITLVRNVGKEKALAVLERKKDKVPLYQLSKVIIGVLTSANYSSHEKEAVRKIEGVVKDRFEEVRKTLLEPLGIKKAVALIDVSGSMSSTPIYAVARMVATMYRALDRVYVFNSDIGVKEYPLGSIDDAASLIAQPGGGTPLWDAIKEVAPIARSEDAVLMIFTDEQENVSSADPYMIEATFRDTPTVVINPVPYPTDFIPKEHGNVVGLAGADINAVVAGLRIIKINKIKQTEGRVDIDQLAQLPSIR